MVPARALSRLLVLAALLLAGCGPQPAPPAAAGILQGDDFARAQAAWRQEREETLRRPDGWTSLVGLFWLEGSSLHLGSAPDNDLVLPLGPARLGRLVQEAGQWQFEPAPGAALEQDGQAVTATVPFHSDRDGEPTRLHFDGGQGLLQLIGRGGRTGLRVRHAAAPARRDFAGLSWWPGGEGWQLVARHEPPPPGRTLTVVDVQGMANALPSAGRLHMEHGGRSFALEAIDNGDGSWLLVFADRTTGHGSYPAGRFLDVAAPPPGQTTVLLDFNRAYNPPCAFTPYATCPLPPPGNRLDLRVEAGERTYPATP